MTPTLDSVMQQLDSFGIFGANQAIRSSVARLLALALLATTAAAAERTLTVTTDGAGDFKSIQQAVDSVPTNNTTPVVIKVAPGQYAERVLVPRGKGFITLRGAGKSRADVIITGGKDKVAVLKVNANDFRAENFTVENTAGIDAGPQQALYSDGQRQVFDNLAIHGWQDTLGSWNGNIAYYHNCEISGSVDFIYSGGTAVFDRCDIIQRRATGGPVAAPSTPKNVEFGLVFLNCRLLKAEGVKTNSSTLMRPWFPDGHTAFIHCQMDDHISPKGWGEWGGREKTCRAVEFGSRTLSGEPINLSGRAPWVKVLTPEQAAAYSITNVLGGWNPGAREHDAAAPSSPPES